MPELRTQARPRPRIRRICLRRIGPAAIGRSGLGPCTAVRAPVNVSWIICSVRCHTLPVLRLFTRGPVVHLAGACKMGLAVACALLAFLGQVVWACFGVSVFCQVGGLAVAFAWSGVVPGLFYLSVNEGRACYSVWSPRAEQRGRVSHLVGTPPTDFPVAPRPVNNKSITN